MHINAKRLAQPLWRATSYPTGAIANGGHEPIILKDARAVTRPSYAAACRGGVPRRRDQSQEYCMDNNWRIKCDISE
jgi:hypothetical protein